MDIVVFLLGVVGAGGIFSLGFTQFASALHQLFSRQTQLLLLGDKRSQAQGLPDGFLAGVLSGTGPALSSALLGLLDTGRISRARASWLLLGLYPALLVFAAFLVFVAYVLDAPSLGPILITVSIVIQLATQNTRGPAVVLLSGLGFTLIGITLLDGYLQLFPNAAVVEALDSLGTGTAGALLYFFVGGLFSLLYRSPLAVVVIAISFGSSGWISGEAMYILLLGSHAIYPLLGIGLARNFQADSRTVSGAELGTNTLVWLAGLLLILLPVPATPAELPVWFLGRIALFYVLHLVLGSLFRLPMIKLFSALERRIPLVQDPPVTEVKLLPDFVPEALEANLSITRKGLAQVAVVTHEMLMHVMNLSQGGESDPTVAAHLESCRTRVKESTDHLWKLLTRLISQPSSPHQAQIIANQQIASDELQKISSACRKLYVILERSLEKQYRFHDEGRDELFNFTSQVLDFLKYNSDYLHGDIRVPDLELAKSMEDGIDEARAKLQKRSRKHLEKAAEAHVRGELAFIDIIGYLEQIGDSCLRISRSLFSEGF